MIRQCATKSPASIARASSPKPSGPDCLPSMLKKLPLGLELDDRRVFQDNGLHAQQAPPGLAPGVNTTNRQSHGRP